MPGYPITTMENAIKGVNYLLSGPGGLGQNFQGYSAYDSVYVTGFFRAPFSLPTTSAVPLWTVFPISITEINPIEVDAAGQTRYIQVFFTPQSSPPFLVGQAVKIIDVVDNAYSGFYNGNYSQPGVQYCDVNYCILATGGKYVWPTYVSGGNIRTSLQTSGVDPADYNSNNLSFNSTDCNARVKVYGGTDTVFSTSQFSNLTVNYQVETEPEGFDLIVAVNRYKGFLDTANPNNNEYLFTFDKTVSQIVLNSPVLPNGIHDVTFNNIIFSTVLDKPPLNYYWYITEIAINTPTIYAVVNSVTLSGPRSATVQVIKQ